MLNMGSGSEKSPQKLTVGCGLVASIVTIVSQKFDLSSRSSGCRLGEVARLCWSLLPMVGSNAWGCSRPISLTTEVSSKAFCRRPGILREAQITPDNMLEEADRWLLLKCHHHVGQDLPPNQTDTR